MGREYEVKSDDLVLDGQRLDVKNIEVTVPDPSNGGRIVRGQVIDRHTETDDGTDEETVAYVPHAVDGEANVIVAVDTAYAAGETSVVVPCYITGEFRRSAAVSETELTDKDTEALRIAGIILS